MTFAILNPSPNSPTLVRRRKRLDVLINNAGIAGPSQPIASLDYATWREVIDTNLHGTFLVTQSLLPFLGKGSVIVNNLSIAARMAFPGMAAYNASKRGLLAFTETLREELRPRGIRVVALLPGATDTGIWQQFWPEAPRRRMMLSANRRAGCGHCRHPARQRELRRACHHAVGWRTLACTMQAPRSRSRFVDRGASTGILQLRDGVEV